jgi:hypothetical protein
VRRPLARGTVVDDRRVAKWLNEFAGYRRRITEARIREWLAQFEHDDQDVAARVLDAVEFIGHEQMENAFRSTLGALSGWHRSANRRLGMWRFVPFSTRPGESGDSMLHVFRTANRLSSATFDEMFVYKTDLLKQQLDASDTVVFVDDFSGTGEQAAATWNETLSELLPGNPRLFLILIATTRDAATRISSETTLRVRPFRRLDERHNFFAARCSHFSNDEKTKVLHYCDRANSRWPRGRGECGLLLVMAHRCPNNSIPILHGRTGDFTGLFWR